MDRFYVNPVPPSGSERRIPSEQPTAGRRSPPRLRHFRFLFLAGSRRRTRRPSTQRVGERRAPRSAALAARLTPPSSHREPRSARLGVGGVRGLRRNAALTIDAHDLSMGLKKRRAPGAAIRGSSSPSRAEPNRAVPNLQHRSCAGPDPQLCPHREKFSSRHPLPLTSPGPTNLDLLAGRGVRRSRSAAGAGKAEPIHPFPARSDCASPEGSAAPGQRSSAHCGFRRGSARTFELFIFAFFLFPCAKNI